MKNLGLALITVLMAFVSSTFAIAAESENYGVVAIEEFVFTVEHGESFQFCSYRMSVGSAKTIRTGRQCVPSDGQTTGMWVTCSPKGQVILSGSNNRFGPISDREMMARGMCQQYHTVSS